MGSALYEKDFYAWAIEQAALLRAGRLAAADIDNIAEEIESMGRSEKRELLTRLGVLLCHLLKWQFQPAFRGHSWRLTIIEQRIRILRHLADNPSLKARLDESVTDAYGDAVRLAAAETGLARSAFPPVCPYSPAQIVGDEFWPESA
jgi:hypothetical protein